MACAVWLPTAAAGTLTETVLTVALFAGVPPLEKNPPVKVPTPICRYTVGGGAGASAMVKALDGSIAAPKSATNQSGRAGPTTLCKILVPPRRPRLSRLRGDITHRVLD